MLAVVLRMRALPPTALARHSAPIVAIDSACRWPPGFRPSRSRPPPAGRCLRAQRLVRTRQWPQPASGMQSEPRLSRVQQSSAVTSDSVIARHSHPACERTAEQFVLCAGVWLLAGPESSREWRYNARHYTVLHGRQSVDRSGATWRGVPWRVFVLGKCRPGTITARRSTFVLRSRHRLQFSQWSRPSIPEVSIQ